MLKHVPNALTVLRFLLIPVIIVSAVKGDYILAIIFLIKSSGPFSCSMNLLKI